MKTDEQWAAEFHDTYEALAPAHNYQTRSSSAVMWPDVPEVNRRLMIATMAELLPKIRREFADQIEDLLGDE